MYEYKKFDLGRNDDGEILLGTNLDHHYNALKNNCVLGSITSQEEHTDFENLWKDHVGHNIEHQIQRGSWRTPRFATTGGVCKKWLNIRREIEFGRGHGCYHSKPDGRARPENEYACTDDTCEVNEEGKGIHNFIWTDGKTWNDYAKSSLKSFASNGAWTIAVNGPYEPKEDTKYLAGDGGTHPHLVGLYRCGDEVATAHAIQNGEALSWKVENLLKSLEKMEQESHDLKEKSNKLQSDSANYQTQMESALDEKTSIQQELNELQAKTSKSDDYEKEMEFAQVARDAAQDKVKKLTDEKNYLDEQNKLELAAEKKTNDNFVGVIDELHEQLEELKRWKRFGEDILRASGRDTESELVVTDNIEKTIRKLQETVHKIESDDPDVQIEKELTERSIENIVDEKKTNNDTFLYIFCGILLCGILLLLFVIAFRG
jgi:hypothetical protein